MPLILPARTLDSGYKVSNSLRFNNGDSAKLTKTPSGDGDRQKWTVNCWFKRGTLTDGMLFSVGTYTRIQLSSNTIYVQVSNNNSTAHAIQTNRLFRDISAWYMITVSCDTTQGTASNRLKLYINGVEETSFSTDQRSAITQNISTATAGQFEHRIGGRASDIFYDGYISEFNFIDGQALAPTEFGETNDNGAWIPKRFSGSYGTNGFKLEFKNSGALGTDTSGNGNDFTANNLTATDQTTDTPTNNFATWNPLTGFLSDSFLSSPSGSLSEGNLKATGGGGASSYAWASTIAVSSGKWYAEFKPAATNYTQFGVGSVDTWWQTYGIGGASKAQIFGDGVIGWDRTIYYINSTSSTSGGVSFSGGDIIQIAFDADTRKVWFGVNNTWNGSGNPSGGTNEIGTVSGTDSLVFLCRPESTSLEANFGNAPYSISSGNSDANGYGNFEYAVPTGFYSLCTKNLAEYG